MRHLICCPGVLSTGLPGRPAVALRCCCFRDFATCPLSCWTSTLPSPEDPALPGTAASNLAREGGPPWRFPPGLPSVLTRDSFTLVGTAIVVAVRSLVFGPFLFSSWCHCVLKPISTKHAVLNLDIEDAYSSLNQNVVLTESTVFAFFSRSHTFPTVPDLSPIVCAPFGLEAPH